MLADDFVKVGAPILVGVISLAAGVSVALYRLRRDQQHWRSENRLDAYADFIGHRVPHLAIALANPLFCDRTQSLHSLRRE